MVNRNTELSLSSLLRVIIILSLLKSDVNIINIFRNVNIINIGNRVC